MTVRPLVFAVALALPLSMAVPMLAQANQKQSNPAKAGVAGKHKALSPGPAATESGNGQSEAPGNKQEHPTKTGPSQTKAGSAKGAPMGANRPKATEKLTQLSSPSQVFLQTVAREDTAEINLAHLALQKSQNPKVKKYAQTILSADPAMRQHAQDVAKSEGFSINTGANTAGQVEYETLKAMNGKQFDNTYMMYEAGRQAKDLVLFKQEIKFTKDQKVKSYAQSEKPAVKKAASKAQQLAAIPPQGFLQTIAREDTAEIDLAHLALQKSNNPQVKKYAQSILSADPGMRQKAQKVAKEEHFNIKTSANTLGQAEYLKLKAMSGKRFDKAYMKYEAKRQGKDLQLVNNEIRLTKNQKVKNYAQQEKPAVQKAANKSQQLASSLGAQPAQTAQQH